MRNYLLYLFLTVALLLHTPKRALSQDIIVKSNNDSIRAKIVEINTENIRFRYFNMKEGPILQIHKNEVKEIIYENGSKLTILYNPYEVSSALMIRERSQAFKVDILAPLFNHYVLGYEMKLYPAINLEFKASLIGANVNTSLDHAEGYFAKCGVKFIKLTNSYMRGLKYIQPLKGSYFKPELIFGQFKRDENHQYIYYTNYAINMVFGRQDVINNLFILDYFGGFGYSYQVNSNSKDPSKNKSEADFTYAYSHLFFGKGIPLIVTGGVLIGIVY